MVTNRATHHTCCALKRMLLAPKKLILEVNYLNSNNLLSGYYLNNTAILVKQLPIKNVLVVCPLFSSGRKKQFVNKAISGKSVLETIAAGKTIYQ